MSKDIELYIHLKHGAPPPKGFNVTRTRYISKLPLDFRIQFGYVAAPNGEFLGPTWLATPEKVMQNLIEYYDKNID